jgi:hypothetical protein
MAFQVVGTILVALVHGNMGEYQDGFQTQRVYGVHLVVLHKHSEVTREKKGLSYGTAPSRMLSRPPDSLGNPDGTLSHEPKPIFERHPIPPLLYLRSEWVSPEDKP